MQHLNAALRKLTENFATDSNVLLLMQDTNWENIPKDTPVIVYDTIAAFREYKVNRAAIRHFAGVTIKADEKQPFRVYTEGRTSANCTSTNSYKYCLTVSQYEAMFCKVE